MCIMSLREQLDAFLQESVQKPWPIHEFAFIDTAILSFTAEVRAACEANACGRYGKCWTCPPGVGGWQSLRDHFMKYHSAFVFTTKHALEDSFDYDGMLAGRNAHGLLEQTLQSYLEEQKGEVYELAGAEGCSLCSKCTYPDSSCRFPKKARKSMEACGIDVVALARDAGIHYMNGSNTVTYFSILFYGSDDEATSVCTSI